MAAVPIGTIKSSTYRSGEKDLTWAASAGVSCTETQPPDGSGSTVLQICRLRAEVLLPGLAALYLVISAGCQRVPSQEDAIAAVVKLGGYVKCADETPTKPVILVNLFQTPTTDHDLDKLTPLTQLECLNLAWTRVSDTGLARVGMFKSRRWLFLQGTRVRGRGLKSLSGLDDLEFLDLSRTQVADSALRQLPAVPQLRTVLLIQCGLTDSATPSLSRLRGLQRLELQKNHITSP